MEDKIIIKSERYKVKKIFVFALIVGIIVGIVLSLFEILSAFQLTYVLMHIRHDSEDFLLPILFSICGAEIFALIIYFWIKSYELNITEKRAYGFAAFGRRVDLPVDSVSAIGLGWLKSIKITTASGKISFLLIKNRDKMYDTISNLIVERQNKETKAETVIKQETSNADELKKYKDLLDSGIITQEEFDQKKKQLLGL